MTEFKNDYHTLNTDLYTEKRFNVLLKAAPNEEQKHDAVLFKELIKQCLATGFNDGKKEVLSIVVDMLECNCDLLNQFGEHEDEPLKCRVCNFNEKVLGT